MNILGILGALEEFLERHLHAFRTGVELKVR